MAGNSLNMDQPKQWYVLRDFKKRNAKKPGYKLLPEFGIRTLRLCIGSFLPGLVREYASTSL